METPLFYFGQSHISPHILPPLLGRGMLIFLFDVDGEAPLLGAAKWVGYKGDALRLPALEIRAHFPSSLQARRGPPPRPRMTSAASPQHLRKDAPVASVTE